MDVKVHFSSRKSGACLDPDIDLDMEVEDFVPRILTKRVLWRVVSTIPWAYCVAPLSS